MNLRREAMNALDAQVSIVNLYNSDIGRDFLYGFLLDMDMQAEREAAEGIDNVTEARKISERSRSNAQIMAAEIHRNMNHASTYYVTDDMMSLTERAAENVPTEPFERDNLPSQSGFVYLPRPLVMLDRWSKRMSARAFCWWITEIDRPGPFGMQVIPTLMFVMFTSKLDYAYDDYVAQEHETKREMWLREPSYGMVHWMPITLGSEWSKADPTHGLEVHSGTSTVGLIYGWLSFLKAFTLLIRQEIPVITEEHGDRASRRRLFASGVLPEFDAVQIVTLRKRRERPVDETDHEPSEVNWSHRWIVGGSTGGFWRNQYYPSERAHRPIWIDPYVKGPEDKPLIVKDTVNVWKR